MKSIASVLVVVVLAFGIGGCVSWLTPEQSARIAKISQENADLVVRMEEFYLAAKAGKVSPEEVIATVTAAKATIAKNMAELEKIKQEGSGTQTTIAAILGMFGRTILHGATKLPIPGPWGLALNGLLGLLLGGSETKKTDLKPSGNPLIT